MMVGPRRSDLLSRPGIEETEDGLRFIGVSLDELPESVSVDDVRPLSEFRADPRVRVTVALGERFGPNAEEIEFGTYADVLDARQRIDAPPTTVWRFVPGV